ncbi:MAG: hypothetical protein AAGA68_26640 [Pseudomonadota bacterium]
MFPEAHLPRAPQSFQPDTAKSSAGLCVLGLVILALVAPPPANAAAGDDDDPTPDWRSVSALTESEHSPCDGGTPLALAHADPHMSLGVRIVHLGAVEADAALTLNPSVFLVLVSADGRRVTAVCDGMRLFEVASPAAPAAVAHAHADAGD